MFYCAIPAFFCFLVGECGPSAIVQTNLFEQCKSSNTDMYLSVNQTADSFFCKQEANQGFARVQTRVVFSSGAGFYRVSWRHLIL